MNLTPTQADALRTMQAQPGQAFRGSTTNSFARATVCARAVDAIIAKLYHSPASEPGRDIYAFDDDTFISVRYGSPTTYTFHSDR